jgi:polyhydroxyalkanoate synthesis regulator phasin
MREAIKRYVDALQSLAEVPRERAETVARRLADGGLIRPSQIREVASDLVERSRTNRRRLTGAISREMRRQVGAIGLATKDDVERLGQRIQALEVSGRTNRAGAKRSAGRRPAARATVASGRAARTTARATARKPARSGTRSKARPRKRTSRR